MSFAQFTDHNEGYVAIKGSQNKVFSFVAICLKSEHAKPDDFWFATCDDAI